MSRLAGQDAVCGLLEDLGTALSSPARSVERFTADLERVLAVLMLGLSEVRTLATAAALRTGCARPAAEAYRRVTVCTAAGIRH